MTAVFACGIVHQHRGVHGYCGLRPQPAGCPQQHMYAGAATAAKSCRQAVLQQLVHTMPVGQPGWLAGWLRGRAS
jgi:hypothetical protein